MITGRLAIIKLAQLSINDYIESGQKDSKCVLCGYNFIIGDDLLLHAIGKHKDWVHWKLLESQVICEKLKDIIKPFSPFGDKEVTGEPDSLEYQDRMFQAPRCKKCNHKDPEYKVASKPPHKHGIKLKCIYCGDISVKD